MYMGIGISCESSSVDKSDLSRGLEADLFLPDNLSLSIGIWSLAHKSDYRSYVLGEHRLVRRSGTASRGVVWVLCLRVRSFSRTQFSILKRGKKLLA